MLKTNIWRWWTSIGRVRHTLRKQIRERERQKIVFLKAHGLSIRLNLPFFTSGMYCQTSYMHAISPKRWRPLETTQFSDVHVHVHLHQNRSLCCGKYKFVHRKFAFLCNCWKFWLLEIRDSYIYSTHFAVTAENLLYNVFGCSVLEQCSV